MPSVIRLTDPAFLPVDLATLREWLRLDDTGDDATLTMLLRGATETVEHISGRVIGRATYQIIADAQTVMILPISPIGSVVGVERDGELMPSDRYVVETASLSPSITLLDAFEESIAVTVEAGYPDLASVPASFQHAIAVLVAAGFADREGASDAAMATARRLVAPQRVPSL